MVLDRISLISNGDVARSPSVPIVGKNLLLGSSAGIFTNIFSYGEGLTAVADNQIVLGKYKSLRF